MATRMMMRNVKLDGEYMGPQARSITHFESQRERERDWRLWNSVVKVLKHDEDKTNYRKWWKEKGIGGGERRGADISGAPYRPSGLRSRAKFLHMPFLRWAIVQSIYKWWTTDPLWPDPCDLIHHSSSSSTNFICSNSSIFLTAPKHPTSLLSFLLVSFPPFVPILSYFCLAEFRVGWRRNYSRCPP